MHRNDTSSNNAVAGNVIQTFGSECFNVKEYAHDNVFADRSPAAPATPSRSRDLTVPC
jgi:hypothetical protein